MFKNARLFQLQGVFEWEVEALQERLAARPFRPCGPQELHTFGWVSPFGEASDGSGPLVHASSGCLLVCARHQERLLPAAVVAEALGERIAEIEGNELRSVGRAERRRLREAITAEMLPRAFTRSKRIRAYLDVTRGWLVVDAASERIAEDLVSLLRETLDTFPATPPRPSEAPATRMTSWLAEGVAPDGWSLGDACELRDPRDLQSVVRCRGQDLTSEEIATHLRAGKQVLQLALDWRERLSFVLGEDLALKRLRLADALIEELDELSTEDAVARLEAELTLLSLEMRGLLEDLERLFELNGPSSTQRVDDRRQPADAFAMRSPSVASPEV